MRRFWFLALIMALAMSLMAVPALADDYDDDDDDRYRYNAMEMVNDDDDAVVDDDDEDRRYKMRPATSNVVHGIPGDSLGFEQPLPVDVCLADGTALITEFEFTDIETLEVPEGSYDIDVRLDAAMDCDGATVLAAPGLFVESGMTYSVVANLTADGMPGFGEVLGALPIGLSVFVDDLSYAGWKNGRVNVRHTAAAPAVDIWVAPKRGDFAPAFIGLEGANGSADQEGTADLRRGRYIAGIALSPSASPDDIAIEQKFKVKRGKALNIYAVGSLADGNFTLLTQYEKLDKPWGGWGDDD